MFDIPLFQQMAHRNRPFWRKTAIGIHQKRDVVSELTSHGRHNGLCSPWPFIDVVPAFGPDAKLECVKPPLIPQLA